MNHEVWVDVEGYEGYYQVSNLGYARSLPRITTRVRSGKEIEYWQVGKVLRGGKAGAGYTFVVLKREGSRKRKYIHRLVAETFIPNPENKPEVNHKDGDKDNNRIDNLEWCTSSENHRHASKELGAYKWSRALSEDQVREIRKSKKSSRELQDKYGISDSSIRRIRRGERYADVR